MHGFAELWTERAVTDSWKKEVWHAVDTERSQDETVVMSHHSYLAGPNREHSQNVNRALEQPSEGLKPNKCL